MPQKANNQAPQGTLGTFAGVFTPSVLTILGIILFLRLGFVVGQAGLARALLIIALANAISILTSISLSAVSTNLKVKGGGDYYLISRTLGHEFGGAIGIVLFLAQSVSIAFYAIGFGEALTQIMGNVSWLSPQVVAWAAIAFLFVFAWLGADWASRFQFVVMAAIFAALVAFYVGASMAWNTQTLKANWLGPQDGLPFWVLFAIFFPAVTGFTQGVSMSGDLKDPGRSLPRGTFAAVGISILVYFSVAVLFSAALPNATLMSDTSAMQGIARPGALIAVGVVAATLSSAMASFLGAPRILQSLASDQIFPWLKPFAKGVGPTGNPRRGVLLSAAIAALIVALGQLNLIAQVVSMFFLISYGLLNYATYFEARAASPSFRPRFRWFNWRLSLLGFLGCLGAMLAIDVSTGTVAIAILFAIFQYLRRTAGPARWADSRRSSYLKRIRDDLFALSREPDHPRDWRPNLLVFSHSGPKREMLLHFASWIQGRAGLSTVVEIIEGTELKSRMERREVQQQLKRMVEAAGLPAFTLAVNASDFEEGMRALVQASGLGPVKANTILLNWVDSRRQGLFALKERFFGRSLRTAFRYGMNLVVLEREPGGWDFLERIPHKQRVIDVWWWDDASSRLMLLLAFLMTASEPWAHARIRLLAAGKTDADLPELQAMLEDVRIQAEPVAVPQPNTERIVELSAGSCVVFIPFRIRDNVPLGPDGGPLETMMDDLGPVVLVMAAEDVELDAEPEDGKAAEAAAAADARLDLEKKAVVAEREAKKAEEDVQKKAQQLSDSLARAGGETLSGLEAQVSEAQQEAERLARRAAKARVKADDAARETEPAEPQPEADSEKLDGSKSGA